MSQEPATYTYYVYQSVSAAPAYEEIRRGVYLVDQADARYLEQFFDPLYEQVGINISTTDDEVVVGNEQLGALETAILDALENVSKRPPAWPVLLGYKLDRHGSRTGQEFWQDASRERIIAFLDRVLPLVRHARRTNGAIHFGGGT